jgi:hypothetical protein
MVQVHVPSGVEVRVLFWAPSKAINSLDLIENISIKIFSMPKAAPKKFAGGFSINFPEEFYLPNSI